MAVNGTKNVLLQPEDLKLLGEGVSKSLSRNESNTLNYMNEPVGFAVYITNFIKIMYQRAYETLIENNKVLQQIKCVLFTRDATCEHTVSIIRYIFIVSIIVIGALLSLSIIIASLGKKNFYSSGRSNYFTVYRYIDDIKSTEINMLKNEMSDDGESEIQEKELQEQETKTQNRQVLRTTLPYIKRINSSDSSILIGYNPFIQ
ncbi:hypothetical protein, conserved [Plasmodium vivax]|uniref:Uncharacterized protein n=1 Tax=Plasmodium vivax TaxID=5855 RepID=A0A1G4HDJ3_PLAVI|nr:hypothetical protein, conserved [Plasmodium vivax]SCO67583.1 hypothetical protein, conserved [Plasmodium vivax]SCO72969.1 hypothetical protein, conserved [Plasmodium vivax]